MKSTLVPQMVDVGARRLGYFHNAGYFELDGDDFDGVFQRRDATPIPPSCRPTSRSSGSTGCSTTTPALVGARGRAHPRAPRHVDRRATRSPR